MPRVARNGERVRANLARIELLRPGVLVADRLLEAANPAALPLLADELYRLLRICGTTVISAPAAVQPPFASNPTPAASRAAARRRACDRFNRWRGNDLCIGRGSGSSRAT